MQWTPSNEIKKPVLLSKASKRIKYLGKNLTKEVKTWTLEVIIYTEEVSQVTGKTWPRTGGHTLLGWQTDGQD